MTDISDPLDGDAGPHGPTRPALRTLHVDQTRLMFGDDGRRPEHALEGGFPTRRALIDWYQAGIVRTAGYLAEPFEPADLLTDHVLVSSMVTGPERQTLVSEPVDRDAAREYRRRFERKVLRPACTSAYDYLRKTAGEYIEDEDQGGGRVDPTDQDAPAMRPGFQEKDAEQAWSLSTLWDGFATESDLRQWLHWLDHPTNGAIRSSFAAEVLEDPVARAHLLRDESQDVNESMARRYRERLAIHELLPAFLTGIRRMDAGELRKLTTTGITVTQG